MDPKLRPLNLTHLTQPVASEVSKGRKFWRKLKTTTKFLTVGAVMLVFGLIFFSSSLSAPVGHFLGTVSPVELDQNRLNILLLGIAGPGHDGPNLTDTIIVASYDVSSHSVDLISLPRDLWAEHYKAKVNTLYQTGLQQGQGLDEAEKGIGEILGIKIPYGVRVTFAGFTKAVDLVGGIDVNVHKTFDDYAYPLEGKEEDLCGNKDLEQTLTEDQAKLLGLSPGKHRVLLDKDDKIATISADHETEIIYDPNSVLKFFPCRFEHIHFTEGVITMDGDTALKYVRSRHALGTEGSDFARSKRQQAVLQAFKDKVLSIKILTDPAKVVGLLKNFGASVEVDLPTAKTVTLIEYLKSIKTVNSRVIDFAGEWPVLVHPSVGDYGGAWVLVPIGSDLTVLHGYIQDLLHHTSTGTAGAELKK